MENKIFEGTWVSMHRRLTGNRKSNKTGKAQILKVHPADRTLDARFKDDGKIQNECPLSWTVCILCIKCGGRNGRHGWECQMKDLNEKNKDQTKSVTKWAVSAVAKTDPDSFLQFFDRPGFLQSIRKIVKDVGNGDKDKIIGTIKSELGIDKIKDPKDAETARENLQKVINNLEDENQTITITEKGKCIAYEMAERKVIVTMVRDLINRCGEKLSELKCDGTEDACIKELESTNSNAKFCPACGKIK